MKREEKRGFSTATACYMKEYNVSRNEAIKAFRAIIAGAWEDVNEGCMRPTPIPTPLVRAALNFFRLSDFAYRDNDEYTDQETSFKHLITKVIIDPIPIY
ncbi:hypothetical protein PTKIN_Ptkin14bG0084200 [Pterospermum kingtungense]